ncbi:MAG TPA: hypothetical protein VGE47_11775, partial [Burkholderiaceae bacterium]
GVRVSFLADKPKEVAAPPKGVLVPPQAIAQRDGSVAFVVADGKAQQRVVKLGADMGKFKLVTEGLKAGETVIVSPPDTLIDGAAVVNKEKQ